MRFTSFMPLSLILASSVILTACNGGGGAGGPALPDVYGQYMSPNMTANSFIAGLNENESFNGGNAQLLRDIDETARPESYQRDDWFIIYDGRWRQTRAVSLQYIRSIVYYDYYQNNKYATAAEFRHLEDLDIANGFVDGDAEGDYYERVVEWGGYYHGVNSGLVYEDEAATYDVSLMTAEKEQKEFFQKAADISVAYSISMPTSLSLVTLGQKTSKMLKDGKSMTTADQAAFSADLQKLAGVSWAELAQAMSSEKAKDDLITKIAENIGTSAANLENRILPDLLGIQL